MTSKIIAVCVLLALMVVADVTFTMFPQRDCAGTPTTFTVKPAQCLNSRDKNFSGFEYDCYTVPPSTACATFNVFEQGNNCTGVNITATDMCGVCLFGPADGIGYHMFQCDLTSKIVVVHDHCDDKCTTCQTKRTIALGACAPFTERNVTRSALLSAIGKCPQYIRENAFTGGSGANNCTGTPNSFYLETDHCYGDVKFSCTTARHARSLKSETNNALPMNRRH